MKHQVIFQPSGRRGEAEDGATLLAAAQQLGVGIEAACGGGKVCGKCRVIIEDGNVSPISSEEKKFFSEEEIEKGYRLACHCVIQGDVLAAVPLESRSSGQVVLEAKGDGGMPADPFLKAWSITMAPPTLEDPLSDCDRLLNGLEEKTGIADLSIDYQVIRTLPNILRQEDWKVTAVIFNDKEVVRLLPGKNSEETELYGVAVDVGTTTVAASLCSLKTGSILQRASEMNPQIPYGEDILARISYVQTEEGGLEKLHQALMDSLNKLIFEMCVKEDIDPKQVDEAVLVYNTAMHHIALNIPPGHVGKIPFAPAVSSPLDIKARDIGLGINPAGNVHSLPVEAGFVGPDNVAVLISEEPYKKDEVGLIIDIGTNGEIDFGNKERLFSTSCATGPALEGAQIKFGMRAAAGAIEKITIDPLTKEPRYKVIGKDQWYPELHETGAMGICGSGIIDGMAELFKAGIILPTGRINNKLHTRRVRKDENGKLEYVLAWADETAIGKDIVISQGDIRAVQLAKAAIYVGAKYLMDKFGTDTVEKVTLAGAFGSYINRESAMVIGLFPDCDLKNVEAVGNAAGDGARLALINREKRREAGVIARKVQFVETAVEPDFQRRFLDAMTIPHAKDQFPHIEHILDAIPGFNKEQPAKSKPVVEQEAV